MGSDPAELWAVMAEGWADSVAAGLDTLILAHRRSDVARLNELARAAAARRKWLGEVAGYGPDGGLRVGDRVLFDRNDRRRGLVNGMRGVIAAPAADGAMVVALASGEEVTVAADYVATAADYVADHVRLGYAMTGHKAQGSTVDATHVYTGGASREWLYSVLSRHSVAVKLYVGGGWRDPDHHPAPTGLDSGRSELADIWSRFRRLARRSERQFTALDAALSSAEAYPELSWVRHLGPVPGDPAGRQRWRQILVAANRYRNRVGLGPGAKDSLLGDRPRSRSARRTFDRIEAAVAAVGRPSSARDRSELRR